MRPEKLTDVVGQEHLLKPGAIIREMVAKKQPASLILWGPPGSGKTTLARLIAKETGAEFVELSAVHATKADVVKVIERAKASAQASGLDAMQGSGEEQTELYSAYSKGAPQPVTQQRAKNTGRVTGSAGKQAGAPRKTVLFVDEIHRFNKAQQDAFLPHVENGTIVLIGATTENPSFEVINPLLSRSRVLVLEPLTKQEIITIIKKTAKAEKLTAKRLPAKSIDLLAELSGGDARIALGNLELATQLTKNTITPEVIQTAAQKRVPGYDKTGEYHYNLISAFIKSLRGSDVNAALYYMARILQGGEDPKFIARRMVIFASEDVGIAASAALNLAVATFQAAERIGMPECQYNLFHCAIVLAKCKKSRAVAGAMGKALSAAKEHPDLPVPIHLRNAPTKLMKELGYQKGYQWQANFQHDEGFLPEELKNLDVFS